MDARAAPSAPTHLPMPTRVISTNDTIRGLGVTHAQPPQSWEGWQVDGGGLRLWGVGGGEESREGRDGPGDLARPQGAPQLRGVGGLWALTRPLGPEHPLSPTPSGGHRVSPPPPPRAAPALLPPHLLTERHTMRLGQTSPGHDFTWGL